MKLAVIEVGGKQYLVREGQKIKTEKLSGEKGRIITFDRVLLVGEGDKIKIGHPYLKEAKVIAELLRTIRNKKIIVFRYHSKTRYRKKKSHRQYVSECLIKEIVG